MRVTYYNQTFDSPNVIANFGVEVPEWHMTIKNLAIIKQKQGNGWFVAMPTFKDKSNDSWEKTISFDSKEVHQKFLNAVRDIVTPYVNGAQT